MRNFITSILFLTISFWTYSQEIPLDSIISYIDQGKAVNVEQQLKLRDFEKLNDSSKVKFLLIKGMVFFQEDKFVESYKALLKAKEYKENVSLRNIYTVNHYLQKVANTVSEFSTSAEALDEENCKIAYELNQPKLIIDCIYNQCYKSIVKEDFIDALQLSYQMKSIAVKAKLEREKINIENIIGTIHYYNNDFDSTLFYFKKNIEYYEKAKDSFAMLERYNNMAKVQLELERNAEALKSINISELYLKNYKNVGMDALIKRNKAEILYANKKYKEAAEYYQSYLILKDSVGEESQAGTIADLQTKYATAEKEKENALLKAGKLKAENSLYVLSIVLGIIIAGAGFFILYAYKQKKVLEARELAEKEKAEKLRKDQELASIDAMIAGQEQERKKIASDLHDDLGSSLTTVKMYIESVQSNVKEESAQTLLTNALNIIGETYSKVRTISHTQNSRVLGESGLVDTLEDLCDKINQAGQTNVEVVSNELSTPISNSKELNLFRIIQELLNNIIKHAKANNASINITSYQDKLDLIIEDDGIGFNYDPNYKTDGIGLHSIARKIENMNGSFEVDSAPGKGSTIMIEIPLK
ncbi:sensor histidine kinase [Nonlabens tegetincola]|uniref:Oxygen sensor histidine kinase NreB n=1 Tax=Nonlabens tegetincola TaxID=323273 RepID=A0A090Q5Z4_9FLAO|nr:ATP-binding protein [Nonlabens tegetincola]GAK97193.1 sensor histidine kinase [Nonlabens tegetincola]